MQRGNYDDPFEVDIRQYQRERIVKRTDADFGYLSFYL